VSGEGLPNAEWRLPKENPESMKTIRTIIVPKVFVIDSDQSRRWGEGTCAIPAPREVDALMRRVPRGRLTTINQLRADQAVLRRRGGSTAPAMTQRKTAGYFCLLVATRSWSAFPPATVVDSCTESLQHAPHVCFFAATNVPPASAKAIPMMASFFMGRRSCRLFIPECGCKHSLVPNFGAASQ
jgi:hypothetical protein